MSHRVISYRVEVIEEGYNVSLLAKRVQKFVKKNGLNVDGKLDGMLLLIYHGRKLVDIDYRNYEDEDVYENLYKVKEQLESAYKKGLEHGHIIG